MMWIESDGHQNVDKLRCLLTMKMTQKMKKSIRLLRIVQLLMSRAYYLTAKELANRLHVDERTIFRDIVDLRELGYWIDSGNGYKLMQHYPSPTLPISQHDLVALQTLIQSSPLLRLPDMDTRFETLMGKLELLVQDSQSAPASLPVHSATAHINPNYKINMQELEKAIHNQFAITMLYQSLDEPSPHERVIHPYALTFRAGEWYLISYAPERRDYRTYRLERIHTLTVTKDKFVRDPDFDLETMFNQSFGVFRGELINVVIRLTGKAARLASERVWHEGTEITWENETTAILRTQVQGTTEILKWTLSMGSEAEVLEPQELREETAAIIKQLQSIYTKE